MNAKSCVVFAVMAPAKIRPAISSATVVLVIAAMTL